MLKPPLRNLLPKHLLPSIPDFQPAVLPLAYRYLSLGWCLVVFLTVHLQKPIPIPHHPVVADQPMRSTSPRIAATQSRRGESATLKAQSFRPCSDSHARDGDTERGEDRAALHF
jgi:hypothetical protein